MVSPDKSIEIFLTAFPLFREEWAQHKNAWDDDIPYGLDVARLSDFAVKIITEGSEADIQKLVEFTEEMLTQGEQPVKEAFTYQFLENLTNRTAIFPIHRFTSQLLPASRAICLQLDNFWGTETPGLE